MSSNDDRIAEGLKILQRCLRSFIEEQMQKEYKDRWLEKVCSSLRNPNFSSTGQVTLDVQALIRIATDKQHVVLYNAISLQGRNYLHELRDVRNRYAHQNEFGERDIDRALDTLELFLESIRSSEASNVALLRKPAPRVEQKAPSSVTLAARTTPVKSEAGIPRCDFIYFATPACSSITLTAEFVNSAKAIIAHAYNTSGLRMPLVQHLRPGSKILLVYGEGGHYSPVFCCQVCTSPKPVLTQRHSFDVFTYVPDSLHDRLKAGGYAPDPVVQRFVGISVGSVQDLRGSRTIVKKPKGNNTLRRWEEVFSNNPDRKIRLNSE